MPEESPQKLDLRSMDITEEKKQQLKQLFPEVFREDAIDFDHLKRLLGEWVDPGKERFGLNWPGKAECMKTIQQPSVATLRPDREESVNFDETEHLFIEGDNLEVLKLLQKSYFSKVKMIYIDPPYNTGNEFIYPDDYKESLDTYLQYTGQKDSEGNWQTTNKETEGRFHSKWLNMMYPRLFLAKNLLREDGVIFISIDDHEMVHLKKLCDEIFGEENFVANVIWQKVFSPKNTAAYFSDDHEYVLVYAKHKEEWTPQLLPRSEKSKNRYTNPDNDPRGPWLSGAIQARNYYSKGQYEVESPSGKTFRNPKGTYWRYSKEKFKELDEDNRIWWGESGDNVPRLKRFLSEVKDGVVPQTLWKYKEVGHTQEAKEELIKFVDFDEDENVLNSVKPSRLIQRMIQIGTQNNENDIVLDFFGGSATTAQAVLNQNKKDNGNRRFVLVQLPEPLDKKEEKVKSISDLGKSRMLNSINEIKEEQTKEKQLELGEDTEKQKEQDLGFKVFKLTPSNFKVWKAPGVDIEPEKLKEQLDAFADHLNPETEEESILYELVLKSGFPLTANIEKVELSGATVYKIEEKKLMICLEKDLTFELLDAIAEQEPNRFICLDNSFTGKDADALKTNAVQLFKSKDIIFKTI